MVLMFWFLLSMAQADSLPAPVDRPPDARWIGTVAVLGERRIPILGTVRFRTDSRVIADVWKKDGGWVLSQRTCQVHFARAAGAQVSLAEDAPAVMPPANPFFVPEGEGWKAAPWGSGWSDEDHDHDGFPGITFHVDATVCSGQLHVGSSAMSEASGAPSAEHTLEGEIKVDVVQRNLSSRGICMKLLPRVQRDTLYGRFAFVEVPLDTSCESVASFPDPEPEKAAGD